MERTCDCCPEPAVVHETLVRDGVKTEVHLCAAHAQERGYVLPTAAGPALVVGKLLENARAATLRTTRSCPGCGMTMAGVREAGLAGCAECYRVFENELGAIIERAQAGASLHVGRHPAHAESLIDRAAARNRLAKELRDAVAREEYERAAQLRDRLQELGAGTADVLDDDSSAESSTESSDETSPDGRGTGATGGGAPS
jgi:protein arginine kinase activator